jgi:Methyltransferase domain
MTVDNRTSFGLHAAEYRRYRPSYPEELFAFLAAVSPERRCALDCATGSGQAAVSLARFFERVLAFDVSEQQIQEALPHERVEYFVAEAESLPGDIGPFDLVTIAQGAHWFDLPRFYAALEPLLKPDAVVAIWGYSHCRITPEIDLKMMTSLLLPIAPYWADGNRIITEKYATIEFPYAEIEAPSFVMREHWDRDALLGYVRTWSAYKRYVAEVGADPVTSFEAALDEDALWPRSERRPVEFDVYLRLGRRRADT